MARKPHPSFRRIEVGEQHEELLVLARVGAIRVPGHRSTLVLWRVKCACGNVLVLNSTTFRQRKSCVACSNKRGALARTRHGDTRRSVGRSALYGIWQAMHRRCYNPRARGYQWYGAKGIRVCAEWRNYAVFKLWAMSNGFVPGLSIERERSAENYSSANCSWITKSDNSRLMREKYEFIPRRDLEPGTSAGLLSFGC
jgi:hypothetical protein